MSKKLSRMECNKEARRALTKSGVDLAYCQFACFGKEVRLTGWLCKIDGTDFTGAQIEAMIFDIRGRLPGFIVLGDLDNWNFTSEYIAYVGERERNFQPGEEEENVVYEINLEDVGLGSTGSD